MVSDRITTERHKTHTEKEWEAYLRGFLAEKTGPSSYWALAQHNGFETVEPELVSAVHTLQMLGELQLVFAYVDDNCHESIDATEVNLALREGVLAHPISGLPIEDFQDKLFPYVVREG